MQSEAGVEPKTESRHLKAPRGTQDYLPRRASHLHLLDERAAAVFERFGYRRIVTPTFEETDLFRRGIGEASDIVRKEMYTFVDRAGRSLTLRPEATAPVVRAFIEHHLEQELQPVKLYYFGAMYRYERPQAGRYREFWQLGAEAFGSGEPAIDAELILLLVDYLRDLGLKDLELKLGSMGDGQCRPAYLQKLRQELGGQAAALCEDCQTRLQLNPLRVFDCKNEACRAVLAGAPKITDHLCDDCRAHLHAVERLLKTVGVDYAIDPMLVRGFDYYTRTTFEVLSPRLGAQNALGGGGRYDQLVEQYGGPPTPAVGFALGAERVMLAMESEGVPLPPERGLQAFVAVVDWEHEEKAFDLLNRLRAAGIAADMDYVRRSLRAQMKLASKLAVAYVIVLGPDEIAADQAVLRTMETGGEQKVPLTDLVTILGEKIHG